MVRSDPEILQKGNFNRQLVKVPRVAIYIRSFPPVTFVGGTEQQCKRLSEELVKKGISLFIVTEEKIENTENFKVINGVPVYRVASLVWLRKLPNYLKSKCFFYLNRKKERYSDSFLDNKNRCRLISLISRLLTYHLPNCYFFVSSFWLLYKKRNDFDVLHIHGMHQIASFGVRIAKLLNKKVIIKESQSGKAMTFNRQSPASKKKTIEADLFVAISNKLLSDLISVSIPKEKIRYIPNGINIEDEKWQFNNSKSQFVICVGNLDQQPLKGLDVLLRAWRVLIQEYNKRIPLQIFGRGDPYLLNQLAIQLGIEEFVSFSGFVDNVKQHLLDACLFVLPSRLEGMSNALLEAMSLGLPCVVTDISGNRDLIQNGINGLLVPSENAGVLAEAVLFMLDNPDKASELGYNARKTIAQHYTISNIADKYIELYKELVNQGKNVNVRYGRHV